MSYTGISATTGITVSGNAFIDGAPRGQVMVQFGNIGENLAELRQRLDTLEEKLTPVLGAPLPTAGNEGQKELAGSALAESLRNENTAIRVLINRVSDLIDRIEL